MAECDNCGRTIGKLESGREWRDHLVCSDCFNRLSPPRQYPTTPQKSETPRIFKWAAWLIVIVVLVFLFDYIGHYYSRQADLQEEEFRLNQH